LRVLYMNNRNILDFDDNQTERLTNILEEFGVVIGIEDKHKKQMFEKVLTTAISSLNSKQSEALLNSL